MTTTKTISKVNMGDEDAPVWKYKLTIRTEYDNGAVDINERGFITVENRQEKIAKLQQELADEEDTLATLTDVINNG